MLIFVPTIYEFILKNTVVFLNECPNTSLKTHCIIVTDINKVLIFKKLKN